jgi:hypothetical protein
MREDKRTGTESFMKRIHFCYMLDRSKWIIPLYIQWQIIRLAMKAPPCWQREMLCTRNHTSQGESLPSSISSSGF